MDSRKFASGCVFAGGCMQLSGAFIHLVWPLTLGEIGEYAGLSADYKNLLMLLMVAVGFICLALGGLSIYFSKRLLTGEKSAIVYSVSVGVLWEIRAILELIFPVKIPFYFLTHPTTIVLPLSVLCGLLFLVPLFTVNNRLASEV